MSRLIRSPLVLAFLGVLALIAMHGISAHGFELDDHHGERHEMAASSPARALPGSVEPAADAGGESHDHGDEGVPCRSCSHGPAALCAFIVLGAAVAPRGTARTRAVRSPRAPRPPLRSWSPEPPVPKFVLVRTPT